MISPVRNDRAFLDALDSNHDNLAIKSRQNNGLHQFDGGRCRCCFNFDCAFEKALLNPELIFENSI
jgi:hypothetical protein